MEKSTDETTNLEKLRDRQKLLNESLEKAKVLADKTEAIGINLEARISALNATIQPGEEGSLAPALEALKCHQNVSKSLERVEDIVSALDEINKAEQILSKGPGGEDLNEYFDALDRVRRIMQFFDHNESLRPNESVLSQIKNLLETAALLIKSMPTVLEARATDPKKDKSDSYWFLFNSIHQFATSVKKSEAGKELLGSEWIQEQLAAAENNKKQFINASLAEVLKTVSTEGLVSPSEDVVTERFIAFDTQFKELYRTLCPLKVYDTQLSDMLRAVVSNIVVTAYVPFSNQFSHLVEKSKISSCITDPVDIARMMGDFFEGEAPDKKDEVQNSPGQEKSRAISDDAGPSNSSPN